MPFRFTGLWRHPDFMKLWAGQTVSLIGTEIRFLALSLTAVVFLDATPVQMGILMAIGGLPPVLIGFLAGTWLDRRRKRPVMIVSDWGRALLILTIPIAALLGVLRMEMLYAVAFGMGTLGLLFDIAYRSILPSLIEHRQLVEGNTKLEVSSSAAEIVGPGIGGTLVHLVTAPIALAVDAVTFVVSAILLHLIRTPEPEPAPVEQRESILRETAQGIRAVAVNPTLRALAGCAGTLGFFNALLGSVFILYLTNELGLSGGSIGLILTVGGSGFLLGALMGERTTRLIGLGPSIIYGVVLVMFSDLLLASAGGPSVAIIILLIIVQLLFGFGFTTYNISEVSLRQSVTPRQLLGRVNATMHILSVGTIPVGALIGGVLGETIDLRPTLYVAVIGELMAVAWLILSPVRKIREQPDQESASPD